MQPTESERILVVDDSPDTLEVLERNLHALGYSVHVASAVGEAARILESTRVDIVVTDLKMPGASGLDLVRHVRENYRDTEVIVITGYPSLDTAVQAVRTGAEDYLAKPFTDEELLAAIRRGSEKLRARRAIEGTAVPPPCIRLGLVGESEAMRAVFTAIGKAATTATPVLISGESGTGKELVARAIHYGSARAASPFVPVNCGGIPEELLESELFGADAREGFLRTADGGTAFLDEVSETSLGIQVKLLRVLQEKQVPARIVAATKKDLGALVEKGTFREDLFYRISVIHIEVPPLRRRADDVLLLARHFASRFAEELDRPAPRFSDRALAALRRYSWPGNVRELENVMQRLVVMGDGDLLDVPDLPALMRPQTLHERRLDRTLAEVETEYLLDVLSSVDGNRSRAAEILGIDRKTLRSKMKRRP